VYVELEEDEEGGPAPADGRVAPQRDGVVVGPVHHEFTAHVVEVAAAWAAPSGREVAARLVDVVVVAGVRGGRTR
jgi:hypothetical protein